MSGWKPELGYKQLLPTFSAKNKTIKFGILGLIGIPLFACCVGLICLSALSPSRGEVVAAVTPVSEASPQAVLVAEASATAAPSDTAAPTATVGPSNTPRPTNTPKPTNTPAPTATETATPEPIILTGTGDSVVDVVKPEGPALIHITYTGGRNFIVENYDANGEQIDLIVNTIGSYEGTRLLDFGDSETARFSIQSSGQWEIQILPTSAVRVETAPGTFVGKGDDVVVVRPDSGRVDLLKIDGSKADRNLIIMGYGNDADLLVNEIAPYSGTVVVSRGMLFDNGSMVLEIQATGEWSIETTTK